MLNVKFVLITSVGYDKYRSTDQVLSYNRITVIITDFSCSVEIDTSELIHFFSNSTPPSTVHQHGVPFGKGHTIQKRYRRPQDTLGAESSNSTPRIKPRKNVGSLPPKSGNVKNELLINGHAVKPSRHYAGSRRA